MHHSFIKISAYCDFRRGNSLKQRKGDSQALQAGNPGSRLSPTRMALARRARYAELEFAVMESQIGIYGARIVPATGGSSIIGGCVAAGGSVAGGSVGGSVGGGGSVGTNLVGGTDVGGMEVRAAGAVRSTSLVRATGDWIGVKVGVGVRVTVGVAVGSVEV